MTKINGRSITPTELKAKCKEYEYDKEQHMMLDEGEDERPYLIKKAMTKIERADFIIVCLYMEYKTERKVASILGCSRTPLHNCLVKIKKKILSYL